MLNFNACLGFKATMRGIYCLLDYFKDGCIFLFVNFFFLVHMYFSNKHFFFLNPFFVLVFFFGINLLFILVP